jgi:hypothetical protein
LRSFYQPQNRKVFRLIISDWFLLRAEKAIELQDHHASDREVDPASADPPPPGAAQ